MVTLILENSLLQLLCSQRLPFIPVCEFRLPVQKHQIAAHASLFLVRCSQILFSNDGAIQRGYNDVE